MAAPTLQEILIGGFAYFIENGSTVDAQTVGSTVKPDVVPLSNWTNGSLGNILDFYQDTEKSDQSFMAVNASGGYSKRVRKYVIQDFLVLRTRQMNEWIWRLQQGFTGKIDEGTAQTPGLEQLRIIPGWLRIQGRQLGGNDRFIQDWWCNMELEEAPKFSDKVTQPALRFTLFPGVAGNSSNFPAAS